MVFSSSIFMFIFLPVTLFLYFFAKENVSKQEKENTYIDNISLKYNSIINGIGFILNLDKQKIIPKPQFSISYKYQKLFLGGIPNYFTIEKTMEQLENTELLNQYGWYYNLTSIEIGNLIVFDYLISNYVVMIIFEGFSMPNAIAIPDNAMKILTMEYLDFYYQNGSCYVKKISMIDVNHYYDAGNRTFCKSSVINTFPDFKFALSQQEIYLKTSVQLCF